MKKYLVSYYDTKNSKENKETGEFEPKDLGTQKIFHFEDGKVSLLSKAFIHASREQQDADRVEFKELR